MREKELCKILNVDKDLIKCIVVNADGDCFYHCISQIVNVSIQELRNIVASMFTDNIYEDYKATCQFSDELIWIRRCKNVNEAKELLSIPKLVWADEFALSVIIQHFDLTLYIINEGNGRNSMNSLVKLGNGKTKIILNRTRREHYNLIHFNSNNEEQITNFYNQFVHQNI